jgi:hypothetical protein
MSFTEATHGCNECETYYESKEELDKHNKKEHSDQKSLTLSA